MSMLGGAKHEALGIMTDGKLVRIAHLARRGGHLHLLDMVEALLPRPLGETAEEAAAEEESQSAEAVLGLTGQKTAGEVELEESGDPKAVLFTLLSRFPLKGTSLALNLAPSRSRLSEFPDDFGLSGAKLARRILTHLRDAGRPELPPDHVGVLKLADGRILSVDHDDTLPLVADIHDLQEFVGGRVQIALVDAVEMALLAAASLSLPADEKVTALAHVGANTSHIIFLRGRSFLRAANPLHIAAGSRDLAQTLAKRMAWSQEEAGLPEPERIALAGVEQSDHDGGIRAALAAEFPQAELVYLQPAGLDTSAIEERDSGKIAAFAVPIALAWKVLDHKLAAQFPTNLIPRSLVEAQKTLRLAWHGALVIALILASVVGLSLQSTQLTLKQRRADGELRADESKLAEAKKVLTQVNKVDAELTSYTGRLKILDSLTADYEHWSRFLRDLSITSSQLGGIWFTKLSPSDSLPVVLQGRALHRDRVPRLEPLFETSEVKEVAKSDIRKIDVYEFTMSGIPKGTPIPPPPPAPPPKGAKKPAGGGKK